MTVTGRSAMDDFLEEVQKVGFFGRLFSWGRIRRLSYEASNEYALLRGRRDEVDRRIADLGQLLESTRRETDAGSKEVARLGAELAAARTSLEEMKGQLNERVARVRELETSVRSSVQQIAEMKAQAAMLQRQAEERSAEITSLEKRIAEAVTERDKNAERIRDLEADLELSESRAEELSATLAEREKKIVHLESLEGSRKEEHAKKISEADHFLCALREDKARLERERQQEIASRFEAMKATWLNHERKVEEVLRALCQKHTIEYMGKEKVPFKGKPDNTLRICDEFVIFDAKSPQGDDLTNFPDYIRKQSKEVQKYVREKDVKKDVFLVVPTNTIHLLEERTIDHGEYKVFIVTVDSLEPIVLSLKKLEDYEFVDQLSPEERDDICRVIGRFSHLTKRRIQVDAFFCSEGFSAIKECDRLPEDMLDRVLEYERATLLNAPAEQRRKLISEKALCRSEEETKRVSDLLDLDTSQEIGGTIAAMPLMKENRTDGHGPSSAR